VTDPNKVKKCIEKPTCKRFEMINNDLVMILMTKNTDEQADICRNGYIRYSENGRLPIFHYHYMMLKYSQDRCTLLFTDTDSLTSEVQTDDIYEDVKPVAEEMFHCCDYPTLHPLYSEMNKKRVRCW